MYWKLHFFNNRQGSQRYILVYSDQPSVSLRDYIPGKVEEVRVRKEEFTICRVTLGAVIHIQVTVPPFAGIFEI